MAEKPAKVAQKDRGARWTLKRARARKMSDGGTKTKIEIAIAVFGYKNHVCVDRAHGFVRRFAVTHAAAHDGAKLAAVLDKTNTASGVWADTAHRSAANKACSCTRSASGLVYCCSVRPHRMTSALKSTAWGPAVP
jgi:hypothetical protein